MTPPAAPFGEVDDLLTRLSDEADLCRNEGAQDIAVLLDEAINALKAAHAAARNDALEEAARLCERRGQGAFDIAAQAKQSMSLDSFREYNDWNLRKEENYLDAAAIRALKSAR